MIINVRGTSGSGKTTLIRRVMDHYGERQPLFIPGRKRPISYILPNLHGGKPLSLIGHYETTCGGCDTIGDVRDAFGMAELMAEHEGCDVIFEGLLIAADVNRTVDLHSRHPVRVVALATPLDMCLESVNARRRAKDPTKPPVNPKNTQSKYRGVELSLPRLETAGVPVHLLDRESAYLKVCRLLLIKPLQIHHELL